jgi:hypothetical protein
MTDLLILYTANLGGAVERLPRLYTFLKRLRQESGAGQVLLLDLGGSCEAATWHCAATEGRSMLIVLDAMGYTAAHTSGLPEQSRARLRENFLAMALVDDQHPHQHGDMLLRTTPAPAPAAALLEIDLRPVAQPYFDGRELRLAAVRGDQVGLVRLSLTGGIPTLEAEQCHDLPPDTPPDATISAAVEFVLAEARRHQRRTSDE